MTVAPNLHRVIPGDIRERTVAELEDEVAYWTWEIEHATSWGAALAAANGFRRLAQAQLARRKAAAA